MTLHKKLFGDVWQWAGLYRKTGKNIGVDPLYISVELRNLIDDFKFWIEKETFLAAEASVRFHHRLVAIHLFANGNGRHARIMTDVLLSKLFGLKSINWSGGHDLGQMNSRRLQYIRSLRAADRGDYTPLLHFVGLMGPERQGETYKRESITL